MIMGFQDKIDRYDEIMERMSALRKTCNDEKRDPSKSEFVEIRGWFEEIDELEPDIKGHVLMQKAAEHRQYWNKTGVALTRANPGNTSISSPNICFGSSSSSSSRLFRSFGEQMRAIYNAGLPSGQVDPRLYEVRATGLSEGIGSDGGFLVQTDFGKEIIQTVWDSNPILSKVKRYQISGNSNGIKIPAVDETSRATGSRQGGVRGYYLSEAEEKVKSAPKFRQMELSLKKLVVLVYATDELLNDAQVLGQFIRDAARREIEFMLADSVINGTGAGMPLGILQSGCLVAVAKESGQTADTVVAENIFKMWSRLQESDPASTMWIVNRNVLPQLFSMALSVGTGGVPVYLPANISGQPYSTLFGRPVVICEQASTLGDLGDIILADLSQYIMIEKGGIEEAVSIHCRFVWDEQVFRFVGRIDGQPALASAITPFKGSGDTVSPFVALAAR